MALTSLKTATLLAGLAGTIVAPGVAQAQFYFNTWGGRFSAPFMDDDYDRGYDRSWREDDRGYREATPMSRGEIASILSRRGYRVSPSMARNNDVYLVEAVDPSGHRLRLVVDAYDATILRRLDAAAPRPVARGGDVDRWRDDDEDFGPPPASPPRVIPGVGPAQRKPAPKKPTTARVEPRAPAPKAATPEPAPGPATPPATAPAPTPPGPAASEQAKPETRAQAEPSPRVIPLYKKPDEGAAEKPAEGPP